jgi:hypothetical protein
MEGRAIAPGNHSYRSVSNTGVRAARRARRWTPGREQFEYICQDGNLASQFMIGGGNQLIDRTSPIVP